MFRTLASYIFGGNKKNESIPMTAPVTTFSDDSNYNMLFYMLDVEEINQLPEHNGQNITFEKFELGKCVTISFSWSTSESRIEYYSSKLSDFIEKNNYQNDWTGNRLDTGKLLRVGSYYYLIEISETDKIKKGWLYIKY